MVDKDFLLTRARKFPSFTQVSRRPARPGSSPGSRLPPRRTAPGRPAGRRAGARAQDELAHIFHGLSLVRLWLDHMNPDTPQGEYYREIMIQFSTLFT